MKPSKYPVQKIIEIISLLITIEGLVTFGFVLASPVNSTLALVFKLLLSAGLLVCTIYSGYVYYSCLAHTDCVDRQIERIKSLAANPKKVIRFYALLILAVLLALFLLLIKTDLVVLNLLIKRLVFPLLFLIVATAQLLFLLNKLAPLNAALQATDIAARLSKLLMGQESAGSSSRWAQGLDRWIYPAALVLTILIVLNFFLVSLPNPKFSCDSYQYWTLSRTIDNDFYKSSSIVQQYIFDTQYSVDAPPFYPILIWTVNQLHDFKIYGGFVINFVVAFAVLYMLLRLSRLLFKHPIYGLLVFLALFSYVPFQQELSAARIIPLAILYQLVMIYYVLTREKLGYKGFAFIGFLAGLSILSRFDFLNASLVLGLVLASIEKDKWFSKLALYYFMVVLTFSPWMYYSYSHFGTPMISKDVRTVTSTIIVHSNNYFPHGQEPPTIFDYPVEGFFATLDRIRMVVEGVIATAFVSPFKYIFIPALAVIGVAFLLQYLLRASQGKPVVTLPSRLNRFLKLGMVYLAIWFTTALSGYALDRYYSPVYLYLSLLLLAFMNQLFPEVLPEKRLRNPWLQLALFVPLLVVLFSVPRFTQQGLSAAELEAAIQSQWQLEPEHAALDGYQGTPVVLVADGHNCCKFGAVSGIKTYCMPFNLDDDNIDQFITDYDDITHVLIPTTPTYRFLSQHLELIPVDETIPMYELVR